MSHSWKITVEETWAGSLDLISQVQLAAMHHFKVSKAPEELNRTAKNEKLILLGMMDKPTTSTGQKLNVATSIIPDVDATDSGACESDTDEKGSRRTRAHSAVGGNEYHWDKK